MFRALPEAQPFFTAAISRGPPAIPAANQQIDPGDHERAGYDDSRHHADHYRDHLQQLFPISSLLTGLPVPNCFMAAVITSRISCSSRSAICPPVWKSPPRQIRPPPRSPPGLKTPPTSRPTTRAENRNPAPPPSRSARTGREHSLVDPAPQAFQRPTPGSSPAQSTPWRRFVFHRHRRGCRGEHGQKKPRHRHKQDREEKPDRDHSQV